jgi:hypothetical protein
MGLHYRLQSFVALRTGIPGAFDSAGDDLTVLSQFDD